MISKPISSKQSQKRAEVWTSNIDQRGEMDEQMSCGPDRSYNEGEETGQGEPRSQSPTRSSGRGPEGTNSLF